ncbi:MAG: PhoH family protein, partial [Marinilabiliaceae bacterium]
IVVRGAWLKAIGDAASVAEFDEKISNMLAYYREHNVLPEDVIRAVIDGERVIVKPSDATTIVHTVDGKPVKPRGLNQQKMFEAAKRDDMVFAIGPAGSGKTYLAIALAVRALKAKEVRKIILSRPAVEAGEKLGFLPGDMKEKIDPYLQPLYDALEDMIPSAKLKEMIENGVIEIAPLAFMRGRTLSHAFVILDEAQNTTLPQIKMFLTRMGSGSKFIITGDPSQVDLPDGQKNGLLRSCDILEDVDGVSIIRFEQGDIVRHKLVQKIVTAFDRSKA